MGAMHNNERLLAMIQNVELLAILGTSGFSANVPLSHVAWIDGNAAGPTPNGSIGSPFHTISTWLTNIGVGATAADSQANRVGLLTPNAANTYTESLAIPAWRNVELRGVSLGGGSAALIVTGSVTWTNTAAGGGTHAPGTSSGLTLHNVAITGSLTVTDDTVTSNIFMSTDFIESTILVGNFTATGCTHLSTIAISNGTMAGNITSTANATGAIVNLLNTAVGGSIVAKVVSAVGCTFGASGNAGSGSITVPATGTISVAGCNWALNSSPVLTGTAGAVANLDGPSWNSFIEAGGTTSNISVLVAGGSQAGLVVNATSLGNADVNISLNGTGASAGLTGGGNFYRETTALTGGHIVTVLSGGGGGEQTGDTIDIVKTDTAAQTYTIKNQAGTTLAICPVSSKCWFRVQFNTVVAGQWGLIGGGAGFT